MVNAVLRNMQRKQDNDPSWLKTIKRNNIEISFPNWLVKKWDNTIWENKHKKVVQILFKKISNVFKG